MAKRKRKDSRPEVTPVPERTTPEDPSKKLNRWKHPELNPAEQVMREQAMRQQFGGRTLQELPAELKKLETDPRYQPWRVTLWIQDNEFSIQHRPVSYFVRGPEAEHAIGLAAQLWERFEKHELGIPKSAIYPEVGTDTIAEAVALDEQDWQEYLKDAIKHGVERGLQLKLAGSIHHPAFWTVPGVVFDVPNHPVVDDKPHRYYPTTFDREVDDSHTPDWDVSKNKK